MSEEVETAETLTEEVTPEIEASEEVVESVKAEPARRDEYLEKAVAKGYNPDKEAFIKSGGNPEDFKTPKQWLEFGELLDSHHQLKRTVEQQNKQIETVVRLSKRAQEAQRETLIKELKTRQREAVDNLDSDKVEQLTEEISKLKSEPLEDPSVNTATQAEVDREMAEFKSRNSWVNDDPSTFRMRQDAKAYADQLDTSSQYRNLSVREKLGMVEKMIRDNYPEKFENKKQFAPKTVESGMSSGEMASAKKSLDLSGLPKDLAQICVKLPKDLQAQFIKDCKSEGLI
jgi:hypothetical protein